MHAFLYRSTHHFPIAIPAVGSWVRRRRIELGLSCAKAGSLSGLGHDWNLLEQGWIPGFDERLLRSIAATLGVTFDALDSVIEPLRTHFAHTEESI